MNRFTNAKVVYSLVGGILAAVSLMAQAEPPVISSGSNVANWTVPPYQRSSGGITTMTHISSAAVFVAVTPCRVFDTRGASGAYGGPRLIANTNRNFDIDSGPCPGIPPGAAAFSMNFGAILPDGDGFITVWPAGTARPTVSSMNALGGEVIANAAIVPASSGGVISIFTNVGVDLYGDINGYFMDEGGLLNDPILWRGNYFGGMMLVINENTTDSYIGTAAIQGYMTSSQDNVSGVYGHLDNSSGSNYGVLGRNNSTSPNAAGVRGEIGAVPGKHDFAGVRGESSDGGDGVMGLVSHTSGEGVSGFHVSPATGDVLAGGHLGFSPSLGIAFVNGLAGTGLKNFLEPHPTDASKMIQFISLEGNEPGTYFRGKARFQNGLAVIAVPEDFRMVTDAEDLSIQVTPIGQMATVAVESIGLERVVVRGSRNVEFFYTVNGVRRAYRGAATIVENAKFFVPESPDARLPGYLSDDEKQRLITNGTYKADGTVNMETAKRLGWDREWEKRARPAPQPAE